jgi:hypothetical protein
MSNKAANLGTKVIINPGTYRESISLIATRHDSSLPITFQAASSGTVSISGAVENSNWTTFAGNRNIYVAPWLNDWGYCQADGGNAPYEPKIVLRREMVFVNGTPMTQVLALSSVKYPGTFFVDETANLVYLWPPSGTNMSTADVEVATEPTLLSLQAPGHELNGIVFRGIVFKDANSCHGQPAVTVSGNATNILFDSDTFEWNNGQGLFLDQSASFLTVQNSIANHNGGAGFDTFQLTNVLWSNDTANYNNWRGALGAYYAWGTGGYHIFSDHNETMTNVTANFNQTHSIHWDTDNANITVNSFFSTRNIIGPLFEKSEGPLTVTNSHFCNSATAQAGYAGFIFRMSKSATLTNNILYNNNLAQILVTGDPGGVVITNWQNGRVYDLVTSDITLTGNTIVAIGPQDTIKDGYLGGTDWTAFVSTYKAGTNNYWNASNESPFVVPTPRGGTSNTLAQWRSNTTQDYTSTFAVPVTNPAAGCEASTDRPDYWLLVDSGTRMTGETGSIMFNLSTVSLGGMGGTVNLSTDGVSAIRGASVSLNPAEITTSGTSVLTFTTRNTPSGTYSFPVIANYGNVTRVVYLTVTVN